MGAFSKILMATLAAAVAGDSMRDKFREFKKKFNRNYPNKVEELKHFENFVQNVEAAQAMKHIDTSATYSHLSPLADMSQEDFAMRNSLMVTPKILNDHEAQAETIPLPPGGLPKEFDWEKKGVVTGVKDQGQCGSCWSFGTVANIEGQNKLVNNELIQLAEQELVDCSKSDMGCNGGLPSRAYTDMIKNNMGLELETDYTYNAQDGQCSADPAKEKVFISDWKQISTDEDQIAAALMKYGPLAIGVNANYFQSYTNGIIDPFFCNPVAIDHAVTLVGFGEENGKKFWRIKNSWGAGWGEAGYVRLARGNWIPTCGLNRMVTSAIVKPKAEKIVWV